MMTKFVSSKFTRISTVFLVLSVLGACTKKAVVKIPGERISVLTYEKELEADKSLDTVEITLPAPVVNKNWSQSGGNTTNVMQHLAVNDSMSPVWSVKIGKTTGSYQRLVGEPIIQDGVVYTIDSRAEVAAFNANNGAKKWATRLRHETELSKVEYGGALTFGDGKIYATTGTGFIAAIDAATGSEVWRYSIGIPMRSKPTYADGRVFALSDDNLLVALDAKTGGFLWDYVGIVETAAILGSAAPAVVGDTVIVAFSSGELIAFRASNGQVAWQDSLGKTGRLSALATLNDIDGNPVIYEGRVYAISHSGRMVSIDIRTGERVWENNVGGIHTPWMAGGYMFVMSTTGEIAALTARDGRVKWVSQLQRFEEPEDRKGLIRWTGPVLIGDRLIVVSSHGYILSISPYTGEALGGRKMDGGSVIPPVVANKTLYILEDSGRLTAWR
jgi:outer membrane protein assembly factor BamB